MICSVQEVKLIRYSSNFLSSFLFNPYPAGIKSYYPLSPVQTQTSLHICAVRPGSIPLADQVLMVLCWQQKLITSSSSRTRVKYNTVSCCFRFWCVSMVGNREGSDSRCSTAHICWYPLLDGSRSHGTGTVINIYRILRCMLIYTFICCFFIPHLAQICPFLKIYKQDIRLFLSFN